MLRQIPVRLLFGIFKIRTCIGKKRIRIFYKHRQFTCHYLSGSPIKYDVMKVHKKNCLCIGLYYQEPRKRRTSKIKRLNELGKTLRKLFIGYFFEGYVVILFFAKDLEHISVLLNKSCPKCIMSVKKTF